MNPKRTWQLVGGIVFVGGVITLELLHFTLHEALPPHLPEGGSHVVLLKDVVVAGISGTASVMGGVINPASSAFMRRTMVRS